MKKWRNLLWVVLGALAFSTVATVFLRRPRQEEAKVASVNGQNIYFKEYRQYLNEIILLFEQFNDIKLWKIIKKISWGKR